MYHKKDEYVLHKIPYIINVVIVTVARAPSLVTKMVAIATATNRQRKYAMRSDMLNCSHDERNVRKRLMKYKCINCVAHCVLVFDTCNQTDLY